MSQANCTSPMATQAAMRVHPPEPMVQSQIGEATPEAAEKKRAEERWYVAAGTPKRKNKEVATRERGERRVRPA